MSVYDENGEIPCVECENGFMVYLKGDMMNTVDVYECSRCEIREYPFERITALRSYVDNISDDFGSTFSCQSNVLVNAIAPNDFDEIETIVRKYIPGVKLKYTLSTVLDDDTGYGIYIISIAGFDGV